jgi:hypothetical protein
MAAANLPTPPPAPGPKPSWLWFWVALLTPPVLTLLGALVFPDGGGLVIGLLGGGTGGLLAGIIMGVRLGKTPRWRVGLTLFLSFVMVPVCIFICGAVCNLCVGDPLGVK